MKRLKEVMEAEVNKKLLKNHPLISASIFLLKKDLEIKLLTSAENGPGDAVQSVNEEKKDELPQAQAEQIFNKLRTELEKSEATNRCAIFRQSD